MTTSPLLNAFTRIRVAAETHMDDRDLAGLGWTEETVTELAIHRGAPAVEVVQFNRQQEGRGVGADYLWWWLDTLSDERIGMLVQAKRLDIVGGRPAVNINHRNGRQLSDLLQTAKDFDVPAMYGVYTGGRVYRRDLPCCHGQKKQHCLGCCRMAVSMISAYQLLVTRESPIDTGSALINESIALEDLVDPAHAAGPIRDVNLRNLPHGELRDFLLQDPDVPQDTGHFPQPYFDHVLRGLRTSPPPYMTDLLAGRRTTFDDERIAGVVIVQN